MVDLLLSGVTKKFAEFTAVDNVDLALASGELISFLGPSGCGKTTLLRMIAGLEAPSAGRVKLAGRDITAVPTHQRNVGMVFQSLALFPHLSVGENIAYGMRVRGVPKANQQVRVTELLELVQLQGTAQRRISQLSGGQRQRVAMARALALKPDIFLLDEPMSALDANLREAMQIEIRQLQQRLGITTIVVTHDQNEAMAMSDTVVVMNQGKIEQSGPPLQIYRYPVNRFVAGFIGSCNMIKARLTASGTAVVGSTSIQASQAADNLRDGDEVTVVIRPEELRVLSGEQPGRNRLTGTVVFIRDIGATVEVIVDCDGQQLSGMMMPKDRPEISEGSLATLEFPAESTSLI